MKVSGPVVPVVLLVDVCKTLMETASRLSTRSRSRVTNTCLIGPLYRTSAPLSSIPLSVRMCKTCDVSFLVRIFLVPTSR